MTRSVLQYVPLCWLMRQSPLLFRRLSSVGWSNSITGQELSVCVCVNQGGTNQLHVDTCNTAWRLGHRPPPPPKLPLGWMKMYIMFYSTCSSVVPCLNDSAEFILNTACWYCNTLHSTPPLPPSPPPTLPLSPSPRNNKTTVLFLASLFISQ